MANEPGEPHSEVEETPSETGEALTPLDEGDVEEPEDEGGPVKTFLEHLEDLRWVFIKVGASLLVALVACLAAAPLLVQILSLPLELSGVTVSLQPLGPMGAFIISMKLALYGGLTISLPFILFFVSDFVLPALKKNEKKFFLRACFVGTALFMAGVVLCYSFVLQITLKAMYQYNEWMGFSPEIWRAEEYFSFVTLLMLGMGLSFELPILVLSLVRVGIVQSEWLRKGRPYFFVASFAVIAFITPDFVSTFFLVIPMLGLMEICIWISWYWDRQARREAARQAETDPEDSEK